MQWGIKNKGQKSGDSVIIEFGVNEYPSGHGLGKGRFQIVFLETKGR